MYLHIRRNAERDMRENSASKRRRDNVKELSPDSQGQNLAVTV